MITDGLLFVIVAILVYSQIMRKPQTATAAAPAVTGRGVNVWDPGSWHAAGDLPAHVAALFDAEGCLAPHIYKALMGARADETCVDYRLSDDSVDAWDNGPATDPFDGYSTAAEWVTALFAGKVTVAA